MTDRDRALELLQRASILEKEAYELLATTDDLQKTERLDGVSVKSLAKIELKTGSLILGQYRVCTTLGSHVYIVRDLETEEILLIKAAKIIRDDVKNGYLVTKELDDVDCIPKAIDLVCQNGSMFAIYDYIPGESLDRTKPLDALKVIEGICDAVSQIHERGYIHKDIKPSNILLDMTGKVHLIDFDIAQKLDENNQSKVTKPMGTPQYAPPEAYIEGSVLSYSADIYSIGVVARELIGDNEVIQKATSENPSDRHQTVKEFVQDLVKAESVRKQLIG